MSPPQMDRSAPAGLATVEAFCNTLDERCFRHHGAVHEPHDELTDAAALQQWLQANGPSPVGRVSQGDLRLARALRAVLRDDAARHAAAGSRPDSDEPGYGDSTDAVLRRLQLSPVATAAGIALRPVEDGVAGALATLTATVARATIEGTWTRLRVCAAPDCRWVYFDRSRNGAGRWCSMSACGNRVKTRRYRQAPREDRPESGQPAP